MHRLRAVALDDHCWGVTQTASPISSGVGGFPDDAVASEDPALHIPLDSLCAITT
ncbi:MAG: hypothetical protein WBX01_09620 [Nitrososphaeraceae archaeon]